MQQSPTQDLSELINNLARGFPAVNNLFQHDDKHIINITAPGSPSAPAIQGPRGGPQGGVAVLLPAGTTLQSQTMLAVGTGIEVVATDPTAMAVRADTTDSVGDM